MVLEAFAIKISLKVSKTIKIRTFLLEIVVFPGKKTPEAAFFGSHILVSSEDIGIVSSEDIGIVSCEDIGIVSSEDIGILSHLNLNSHNILTAKPSKTIQILKILASPSQILANPSKYTKTLVVLSQNNNGRPKVL